MTPALAPGDMLGVYQVKQELGRGAVGIVYSGIAPSGEPVAIKVLRPELARDARFLARFDHEARAAQAIESNHLVPLLDVGEDRDLRFLVSRLMPGGTLRMLLDQRGPLPLDQLVANAADIARGLDAMHAHGLLHRDVKPSNVLFDDGGRAQVADFGLAKGVAYTVLTKPGEVMGTLDYLAPELVRGHDASQPPTSTRSDVSYTSALWASHRLPTGGCSASAWHTSASRRPTQRHAAPN